MILPLTLALLAILAGSFFAYHRFSLTRAEEDDAARVMRLHDEGKVNEFGEPYCAVVGCKRLAEVPVPFIDQPALDKLPVVRRRHKLYALPWRYIVVTDRGEPEICSHHGVRAGEQLEHILSTLRAEHSQFNSEQHSKVAVMNGGGTLEWLNRSEARVKETISQGSNGSLEGTFSLPAYTSGEDS